LEIRIVPKVGCYVVEVPYEKLEQPLEVNQRVAAIDLGLNNLATLTYNVPGLVPTIFDKRAVKSTNQYCNQVSSVLKSLLPAAQKNSKKLAKLWSKRNCKVDYYLHTTSYAIIKELVNYQIGLLAIGWNQDFKDGIKTARLTIKILPAFPIADSCKCCSTKNKLRKLKLC
jgi:transposase